MDRVWQQVWDRYGHRYGWAVYTISCLIVFPIFATGTCLVVAFEHSDRYLVALAIAVLATAAALFLTVQPGSWRWGRVHRWASGERTDELEALDALEATYTVGRRAVARGTIAYTVIGALMFPITAAVSGSAGSRLLQWAILGGLLTTAVALVAIHSYGEAFLRPARIAMVADSPAGDSMPRARPSFAAWSNLSLMATVFAFTIAGVLYGTVIDSAGERPVVPVVITIAVTLVFGLPITMASAFAPSLRPIRDLAEGTARVAAGDYSQRLPVVQDDDLGVLVASFNRMQAGLAERQRLQAAFGSYVDPGLAARLLAQGDDLFSGERREVTLMFVDIRDFTPFAESHTAEETVAHLNAVFEIIVCAVTGAGGHVNKYLGDGALAVFGAPNNLAAHADAAVAAALEIRGLIAERFDGATRIGIGINTGQVIAGTVGGAGKLEFTLIGDAVNVAGRIEQLTKTTGDTILLTKETLDSLGSSPVGLVDRGAHALKGKASTTGVYALGIR